MTIDKDLSKYTDKELRDELKARALVRRLEKEGRDLVYYFNNQYEY